MNANNQNQREDEVPQTVRYFRPWEAHNVQNAARPNAAAPQPVVSPWPWWNYWYIQYSFMVAAKPIPAGGATTMSTPQAFLSNHPIITAAAPQKSRNDRKFEVVDEQNVKFIKKIAQLSREQVEKIIPYRREMARTFAPKERTPAEQLKRARNTEACRLSRRRKKLQEIMRHFYKMTKYGQTNFCKTFSDILDQ